MNDAQSSFEFFSSFDATASIDGIVDMIIAQIPLSISRGARLRVLRAIERTARREIDELARRSPCRMIPLGGHAYAGENLSFNSRNLLTRKV